MSAGEPTLIPARHDPRVARFFAWYTRRLFVRSFFAVRLMPGSSDLMRSLNAHAAPAIFLMTHGSWWDPMTAILLHNAFRSRGVPLRPTAAPMDAAMLRRFGFFRRLGVFGIDPDSPASLEALGRHVLGLFAREPRTTLWITAQGRFHDPRTPPRLRPGAAWIAARTPGVRVLCCAVEYAFWNDQRAEVFIRMDEVRPERRAAPTVGADSAEPPASTSDWLRAMQGGMTHTTTSLAEAVISRDPARFEVLLGGRTARVHPLFDLWQRLRGEGNAVVPRTAPRTGAEVVP